MSDLRDDPAAEVTVLVPPDLWRCALTNARGMGLTIGRRSAEDVVAAYLLYLLTKAAQPVLNAEAGAR